MIYDTERPGIRGVLFNFMEEQVLEKESCKCGYLATWCYMPCSTGNPYYCDSCVPRGCSCSIVSFSMEAYLGVKPAGSGILEELIERKAKFRVNDSMIGGEESHYLSHKYIVELDNEGREEPCVEFWYSEAGWEKEGVEI